MSLGRLPRSAYAVLLFLAGAVSGVALSHAPSLWPSEPSRQIEFVHIRPDGTKEWFLGGCRHRTNGPAVELPSGTKEWWTHGKHVRSEYPASRKAGPTMIFDVPGVDPVQP